MAKNGRTETAVRDRHERRTPVHLCSGSRENWKDPESGEWLRTCTIITGASNELVAQIHPRMPVILPEEHRTAWLGETEDGRIYLSLSCRPDANVGNFPPRVNSPKNGDPSLWEPLHAQPPTDVLELLRSSERADAIQPREL
jgi:putative SOS response-associated peptidase YedK